MYEALAMLIVALMGVGAYALARAVALDERAQRWFGAPKVVVLVDHNPINGQLILRPCNEAARTLLSKNRKGIDPDRLREAVSNSRIRLELV